MAEEFSRKKAQEAQKNGLLSTQVLCWRRGSNRAFNQDPFCASCALFAAIPFPR
jgi:hypothetical protein